MTVASPPVANPVDAVLIILDELERVLAELRRLAAQIQEQSGD